jgi:hypothetical protein
MTHDYTVDVVYTMIVNDCEDAQHAREVAIEMVRSTYASPDEVEVVERNPGRDAA